jgi:formate dehydrogenase
VSARELVEEFAGGMLPGHTLYAYLPGGASGGILPAALADLPLDFDTLAPYGCFIGSAAVVILSHHDRARNAAQNLMRFFASESCGKCTPCREGTARAVELMGAPDWDTALLTELGQAMADASICGLGQAAPNPVRCVMQYFAEELER